MKEAKPIYWLTGTIHSPETGSPEMLMELAYRLAVEETPTSCRTIRDQRHHAHHAGDRGGRPRPRGRCRQGIVAAQARPRPQGARSSTGASTPRTTTTATGWCCRRSSRRTSCDGFLHWQPTVVHDLHESVPFLYTSTGTGPYNDEFDPIVDRRVAHARLPGDHRAHAAWTARRVDARLLRRLGAQLHARHRQSAQLDRPLLRDVHLEWRRLPDREPAGRADVERRGTARIRR